MPVCRSFSSAWSRNECLEHVQRVSRDVARARECPPVPKCTRLVPATNRNLAFAGNIICPFAGLLCKPSDGLEPSTPSLPWRIACPQLAMPRRRLIARFSCNSAASSLAGILSSRGLEPPREGAADLSPIPSPKALVLIASDDQQGNVDGEVEDCPGAGSSVRRPERRRPFAASALTLLALWDARGSR